MKKIATYAMLVVAMIVVVGGCGDGLPTGEVTSLHVLYEKTGGFVGGVSDRLELSLAPRSGEATSPDVVHVTPDQAQQILQIVKEEGAMKWRSVGNPGDVMDVFEHDLKIRINETSHAVHVYELPDPPVAARRIESLVRQLREAVR